MLLKIVKKSVETFNTWSKNIPVVVRIGARHISDAGILVEMAPKRVTRVDVAKVAKGDPGATKNMVMKTIDCW